MKKIAIISILFFSVSSFAQKDSVYYGEPNTNREQKKNNVKKWNDFQKKLFTGGNFGLLFGTYTLINLSPFVGYKATDNLQFGVGVIYNYSSYAYGRVRYTQSIYGGQSFMRYFVTNNLFAQAQFNLLNQPNYLINSTGDHRTWVDYSLVGAGYRQPLGNNASFITSILYNLTPQALSRYYYPINPMINIGFIAGF